MCDTPNDCRREAGLFQTSEIILEPPYLTAPKHLVWIQARSQGGDNGGNYPHNSKSWTKIFQVNQAFDV